MVGIHYIHSEVWTATPQAAKKKKGFVQGTLAVSAAQESFNAKGLVVSDDARTTSNFSMMLTNFVMSDREACRTT